jgi:hypothetical protein
MSNMSYCRFENTYNDLVDCWESVNDKDLSDNEKRYRDKLMNLCKEIAEDYMG